MAWHEVVQFSYNGKPGPRGVRVCVCVTWNGTRHKLQNNRMRFKSKSIQ